MHQILIKDLIHSTSASSPRKGLIVYENLKPLIEKGEVVNVSFKGIEDVVTSFTNAAFGRLYMEFPQAVVDQQLKISDVTEIWLVKINLAVRLATDDKARDTHTNSIDEILNS